MTARLSLAVVGAGPVGLSLALHAAQALPDAQITVFDARTAEHPVARDPRTLALSLGSLQVFERLGVWRTIEPASAAIREVHVSQHQPSVLVSVLGLPQPEMLLGAAECGVERLGAVASYGAIVAPLQAAWLEAVAREPARLSARFGTPVAALKALPDDSGIEVDAGIAERFDLAVVAEGGVFATQVRKALVHDYRQTAWVGQVELVGGQRPGCAYERFTAHGPVALLPLPGVAGNGTRAALVWCVDADDDPVRELDDRQRVLLLGTLFHASAGRVVGISPLKAFPLGLNAERTLVEGRSVRIGNAAQTLHPVAGQGLNLGLRDAHALVSALRAVTPSATAALGIDAALRRVEWQRAADRWAPIATTDFLARSFTWRLPGLATARGAGLATLQALAPARRMLARRMMFGWR